MDDKDHKKLESSFKEKFGSSSIHLAIIKNSYDIEYLMAVTPHHISDCWVLRWAIVIIAAIIAILMNR